MKVTPQAVREWEDNVPDDMRRQYERKLEDLAGNFQRVERQIEQLHAPGLKRFRLRVNRQHRIVFDREGKDIVLVAFRYRNHKDQHYEDLLK